MKRVIVGLFLVMIVTGCSSDNTQETSCTSSMNDIQNFDVSITYDKESDAVKTIVYKTNIKITKNGYTKKSLEDLGKRYQEKIKEDSKGIEFSYELTDKAYQDTITVDFDTADFDVLKELGIVQSNYKKGDTTSYKRVVEDLKAVSFTCEEK